MGLTIARSPEELQPALTAWEDLARHALESNVFYEAWTLVPALELLGRESDVQVALVWSDRGAGGAADRLLIGLFPFVRCRGYRGLPVNYLSLWRYPQCFLCTPLVREGCAAQCLDLIFAWMEECPPAGIMLQMNYVRGDGPFYDALQTYLRQHHRPFEQVSFQRALLQSDLDGTAYIRRALSSKSRREFERQGRRLAALGELVTVFLDRGDDIDYWITHLIRLEGTGWKRRAGTALALNDPERVFFERVVRAAFARGRLMMEMLKLNQQPIAVRCTFLAGSSSYGLKIAYDEDYAKYSPGVQLEFEVLRRVLQNRAIAWMDSCAEPDHPMFNRLWTERRTMRHVNISTPRIASRLFVSGLGRLRALYRRLRFRCKEAK